MDSEVLDYASIVWAAATYAVANIKDPLPRDGDYPEVNAASPLLTSPLLLIMLLIAIVALRVR